MPDPVTLTPEEMDALITAGELTLETAKFLPDKMNRAQAERKILNQQFGDWSGMMMPGAPGGKAAPLLGRGIGGAVGSVAKTLVPIAAQGALTAAGHPFVGMAVGHGLGRTMGRMGKGKPVAEPASPPAEMSGTGYSSPIPAGAAGTFSVPKPGPAAPAPPPTTSTQATPFKPIQAGWSMPGGTKPPVPKSPDITRSKSMEDVAERVIDGGVKAPQSPRFGGSGKVEKTRLRMPTGSGAAYDDWVEQVDAQVPTGSVQDLLRMLADSLKRKP
jgi:hypothetical protein